ncbi:MAG: hypothetical protein RL346_371 [Verrucomicrobiota bacterium]
MQRTTSRFFSRADIWENREKLVVWMGIVSEKGLAGYEPLRIGIVTAPDWGVLR